MVVACEGLCAWLCTGCQVLRLAIKADTRVEAPSSSQAASGQPDERAASSHISGLSAMVLVHLLMHGALRVGGLNGHPLFCLLVQTL